MKIQTAIKKLQERAYKDPKAIVELKIKSNKVPVSKRTETLANWARTRSKDGGTFSFLEACRYYHKIGGSAGATTVRHRLEDMGARSVSTDIPDTHFDARWTMDRGVTTGPIKDVIAADPTFRDRYEAARRDAVARGGLAPEPFERAVFHKDYGKKGQLWVRVSDPDRDRQLRIEVKPRADYVPNHN